MKTLLLLPGFSEKNKELLDTYSKFYSKKGYNVETVEWQHWKTGDKAEFIFENEVKRIVKKIKEYKSRFIVIAKSIGTLVFSSALKKIDRKHIEKIIYLGLPLSQDNLKKENEIELFSTLNLLPPDKITIVQASNDPLCSYEEANDFIRNKVQNEDIKVIEIQRDDHIYPIEDISSIILL